MVTRDVNMGILPEHLPGEKLAAKVYDDVVKGLGVVTRPWVSRRDAAAKAEAARIEKLVEAQTEKDLEDIKQGKAVYTGQKLLSTSSPGAISTDTLGGIPARRIEPFFERAPKDSSEFVCAAVAQDDVVKIERALTLQKIVRYASEEAETEMDDASVSDEPIDPDWFVKWRNAAQDTRTEHMQRLWAKILKEECKKPNSYSLHAIDFLSKMSKKDAEVISRVAPYVINSLLFHDHRLTQSPARPQMNDILYMEGLGLVIAASQSLGLKVNLTSMESHRFLFTFVHAKRFMIVTAEDPNRVLEFPIIRITPLGLEIMEIGSFEQNAAILYEAGNYIKDLGFSVEICEISAETQGPVNCQKL